MFVQETEPVCFQSTLTPYFLLRMGGLPLNVLDGLRFEHTSEWIEALLSLEQVLGERKDRLVDALHEAVRIHKEQTSLRRTLLNLKRDVFNMRQPDNTSTIRNVANKLSSPTREWLEEWADIWERYRYVLAHGSEIFQVEMDRKRILLKQIVKIEDFRKGVLLSSSALDQAISSYLTSDNLRPGRAARTAERSLVEYLLRTACKTSPFSTFTTVNSGTFVADADGTDTYERGRLISYEIDKAEKKSFIRLNVAILSKLSSLLLSCDSLRQDLPVQFTPGYHIQNNRIRYLRRIQETEDAGDGASIALDAVHESVFYLPVGKLLTALLTCLGDRKVPYGELVEDICSLPACQGGEAEIDPYLQHLLRLGLLIVPDIQLDIHNASPISRYCQGLRAIGAPKAERVARLLDEIETLCQIYATATISHRRELLAQISQQVQKCYAVLGQEQTISPRTLLYEDTAIHFRHLHINESSWKGIFKQVAELQQILPIFDVNLPRRLVTRGYFQARYGEGERCDDFLEFAYEFRLGFFEHYLQATGMGAAGKDREQGKQYINYFQQPEFIMLNSAQQASIAYIQAAYEQLPFGARELRLDNDFISTLLPYIPAERRPLSSHTLFSQFANVNGEPLLMINRIYTGLTLMFSRFAHFLNAEDEHQLIAGLRAHLASLQPPDAIFAELKGGYDTTNLNLHPQVTAYELVCPGDISSRPAEEQIPLNDLSIQDDVQGGRLRLYSRRLGKEVIPLYLGFLVPLALPEIQQVLLNFSYSTMSVLDLWNGVKREDADASIIFYPRLRYKNLVLQRAHWRVKPQVFPRREIGQTDAAFFLNVSRWRRKYGFPLCVFVAPEPFWNAFSSDGAEGETKQKMRTYKPLYVDFENYFSIALLESLMRNVSTPIVISEMLPDREQLWLKHNGQAYVSELVWETNSFEGGLHGE
ncbi:hypothetical protein EPA93_46330 [Ktedonosporobacter rubrisoli]|uniref:Lantibiotic dehydratase N-terminal domain-containing protein n=1 Tax=Ktedonosporobacter rubrisoli TaxID=2509675 RepID=A0A4V0Z0F0_KTERU|nr:lantibiotic dehydratase [Ktedonosporobacter rubrisoli]QBD82991.1 hypothetical protein EPA93_46330 [Ktedonosporobacter rubrisoli]